MNLNSLKARLILSALLMVVVLLPIIGVTLNSAFEKQIRTAIKNELSAYSYSLLAVAEVDHQQLLMPEQLLENQFNVIQSGLYALFTKKRDTSLAEANQSENQRGPSNILWRSPSLIVLNAPPVFDVPALGSSTFAEILLDGKPHLIFSISVSFTTTVNGVAQSFPVTLHIIKDQRDFVKIVDDFNRQLWSWLLFLMLLLMLVQVVWLLWTLKPLRTLTAELTRVEQGKSDSLQACYPQELEQVTTQLNALLKTEQNQRIRHRNSLSDLAHSLKTPLAVIQSQGELSSTSIEQLTQINQMIEHQLKRAQSAGESSWHLGVNVKSIVSKLISTLNKIYRDKQLEIICDIDEQAIFKGDEADLMEIIGNVAENAYKAAKTRIVVEVKKVDQVLQITITDDGIGINDEYKQQVLSRGMRADTYQQGHGIGLAIVRDLVASYQGELAIYDAAPSGGAKFVIKFEH